MTKNVKIAIGWVISIIIAIIGAFWGGSNIANNQSQSITVNVNGQKIIIDAQELQDKYDALEIKYKQAESEIESLRLERNNSSNGSNISNDVTNNSASNEKWLEDIPLLQHFRNNTISNAAKIESIISSQQDIVGRKYNHGIVVFTPRHGNGDKGHFIEYFLEKRYSFFTYTLAIHKDSLDMGGCGYIVNIFLDDNEFSSIEIPQGFISTDFEIPIKNINKLKIEIISTGYGSSNSYHGSDKLIIGNAILSIE